MRDRRYTSRFRQDPLKEEDHFSVSNYEPKPLNLARRIVIWAPVVIAMMVGAYFLHTYING